MNFDESFRFSGLIIICEDFQEVFFYIFTAYEMLSTKDVVCLRTSVNVRFSRLKNSMTHRNIALSS